MKFLLYIAGFITAYVICKLIRGKDPENNEWDDVKATFGISIFSWIPVVVILILIIIMLISKVLNTTKKPPRWM